MTIKRGNENGAIEDQTEIPIVEATLVYDEAIPSPSPVAAYGSTATSTPGTSSVNEASDNTYYTTSNTTSLQPPPEPPVVVSTTGMAYTISQTTSPRPTVAESSSPTAIPTPTYTSPTTNYHTITIPANARWVTIKRIGPNTWTICTVASIFTCCFCLLPCGLWAFLCPCDGDRAFEVDGRIYNERGEFLGYARNMNVY